MKNTGKQGGSVIWRIAIFAVSVYMIITLCSLMGELVNKKSELGALEMRRNEINLQIEELTALLSSSEEEIVEKAARERLGYVYSDEQVYIDNSGN